MHLSNITNLLSSSIYPSEHQNETNMRPYKPAPKNASSANRIRERYLHQLGLQRGVGGPLTAPHQYQQDNHVVVISGLPSLPEDRATTNEHVMESHDFSISRHSRSSGGANSFGEQDVTMESNYQSTGDAQSQCSKSTLSVSPSLETGENLTSMALAYPSALRQVPPPAKPTPPPYNNNTLPFSLSSSVPWRTTSLSKPASVLLDSADHDSVSSVGTSTTAESSLNIISRDWGAIPHSASAGVSISSQGGGESSPASTPGVYFQCGHPRLLSSGGGQQHCATTSSLAHALNRFNIDSDSEASVASTSIAEDHIMDEDDASFASHTSSGSTKRQLDGDIRVGGRRKKIGRTQRLMDRAAAHERIQMRNDRSQKMRANLVHSQMMGSKQVISGLSSVMTQDAHRLDESYRSSSSVCSQGSHSLVHVHHGVSGSSHATFSTPRGENQLPLESMVDLGRTPTASNCYSMRMASMPMGVHVSTNNVRQEFMPFNDWQQGCDSSVTSTMSAPLECHPQLASRIPTPPPKLGGMILASMCTSEDQIGNSVPTPMEEAARDEAPQYCTGVSALQHKNHQQASVDDIMEVAMTLSKLGGVRTGAVPRIR